MGDAASGEILRKKISIPAQYYGYETWSKRKIFIYINGTWEEEKLEEIN